jgi:hypothetical protein
MLHHINLNIIKKTFPLKNNLTTFKYFLHDKIIIDSIHNVAQSTT